MGRERGIPHGCRVRGKWLLIACSLLAAFLVLTVGVFWWVLEFTPVVRGYVANESYLQEAAVAGNVRIVQAILGKRPELANRIWGGSPPLYEAARAGQLDVAKVLIRNGADVDFVTPFGGHTPIMGASLGGQMEVTEFLIRAGADVNAVDSDGETALDFAREYGGPEVVKLLLRHGAKTGGELSNRE